MLPITKGSIAVARKLTLTREFSHQLLSFRRLCYFVYLINIHWWYITQPFIYDITALIHNPHLSSFITRAPQTATPHLNWN